MKVTAFLTIASVVLLLPAFVNAWPTFMTRFSADDWIVRQRTIGCPGTCVAGREGLRSARKDCGGARCEDTLQKCTVQSCMTVDGSEGFKCDCPPPPSECPDICRTGRTGRAISRTECKQGSVCSETGQTCKIQECMVDGEMGIKCGCAPFESEEPEE